MSRNILMIFRRFHPHVGGVESQGMLLCEEYMKLGYRIFALTRKYDSVLEDEQLHNNIIIYRFNNYLHYVYLLVKLSIQHHFVFIMSHQLLQESLILGVLKFFKLVKHPVIGCIHSGGENSEIMKVVRTYSIGSLYVLIYFFIFRFNYINCLNNSNYKQLNEYFIKDRLKYLKKLTYIPNGVRIDTDFVAKPKRTEIGNLLFLGRFEEEKGIFETIEAFKSIDNKKLILNIVGYGDESITGTILNKIKDDERIVFLGKQIGIEKDKILSQTDLLVFPTYYSEGQPIVLTEAMLYNIPVITTRTGNNESLFGNNVIYVQERSVSDLVAKILSVTTNDNISYNYDVMMQKLNISHLAQEYLNLLK